MVLVSVFLVVLVMALMEPPVVRLVRPVLSLLAMDSVRIVLWVPFLVKVPQNVFLVLVVITPLLVVWEACLFVLLVLLVPSLLVKEGSVSAVLSVNIPEVVHVSVLLVALVVKVIRIKMDASYVLLENTLLPTVVLANCVLLEPSARQMVPLDAILAVAEVKLWLLE